MTILKLMATFVRGLLASRAGLVAEKRSLAASCRLSPSVAKLFSRVSFESLPAPDGRGRRFRY